MDEQLLRDLWDEWESNHAEHCTNMLDPDGRCPNVGSNPRSYGCQWPAKDYWPPRP